MEEPSVLDYLKSLLTPWRGAPIKIPPAEERTQAGQEVLYKKPTPKKDVESLPEPEQLLPYQGEIQTSRQKLSLQGKALPWRSLLALILALAAQWFFAPPERMINQGAIFLLLTFIVTLWSISRENWRPAPGPGSEPRVDPLTVNVPAFWIGLVLAALAFMTSGNGKFTFLNISLLAASLISMFWALWLGGSNPIAWTKKLYTSLKRTARSVSISPWTVLLLAATVLVLFFRLYKLGQIPLEMVSDHAEKYLDIKDILNGNTFVFFPRNGGREALQFYLVAGLIKYFDASVSHLTLKISTALIGILALPYIYLLGKEIGNRRIALLAFVFAGIAYWTNVVSRAGMRLPFYFLFTAATLYYLLRGIRTANRNDFILSGLALGLGFYGYSADRLLPLVVILAVGLYLLHRQSRGLRKQTIWQTIILTLMSIIVFLPLLRYLILDPEGFASRMFSRMGNSEQAIAGSPLMVFLDNLWKAITMFSWSNGVVWGVSIPDYPALGVVSGGLFFLGVALILIRYIQKRHWLDLFLLISIPMLMLPSILALAFPAENPNLYRTGGAMIPVFLLVGISLDSLMTGLENFTKRPWGIMIAWALFATLFGYAIVQNYNLVFNKYNQQYNISAWNTSEMGAVIQNFSETIGSPDTAWVMGYPHWVDTRLVAINAGYPDRDYAMFVETLAGTQADKRPKLFIVNPLDHPALSALSELYPKGWQQVFDSKVETKDFILYFVPPAR